MDKLKPFLFLNLFLILFLNCTRLQYRRTDEQIISGFKEKHVKTELIYKNYDSLNIKLRIQKVASQNSSKVNLVFLHGSPSSLTAWRAYMSDASLIKVANLYAIDRPGYGYSNFGKGIPSIEDQSLIISKAIQDLQLKNVITLGTSYGGAIAARIALLNSEVKGVVMASSAIDPEQEKKIWASGLTQWWLTRWIVPTGYRVAGDEKTIHAAELAMIEKDWQKLNLPILHVHGDDDNLVPVGNTSYTDSTFTNAEIKIYKGINHDLAWEHPDILIPEILNFLKKVDFE